MAGQEVVSRPSEFILGTPCFRVKIGAALLGIRGDRPDLGLPGHLPLALPRHAPIPPGLPAAPDRDGRHLVANATRIAALILVGSQARRAWPWAGSTPRPAGWRSTPWGWASSPGRPSIAILPPVVVDADPGPRGRDEPDGRLPRPDAGPDRHGDDHRRLLSTGSTRLYPLRRRWSRRSSGCTVLTTRRPALDRVLAGRGDRGRGLRVLAGPGAAPRRPERIRPAWRTVGHARRMAAAWLAFRVFGSVSWSRWPRSWPSAAT